MYRIAITETGTIVELDEKGKATETEVTLKSVIARLRAERESANAEKKVARAEAQAAKKAERLAKAEARLAKAQAAVKKLAA